MATFDDKKNTLGGLFALGALSSYPQTTPLRPKGGTLRDFMKPDLGMPGALSPQTLRHFMNLGVLPDPFARQRSHDALLRGLMSALTGRFSALRADLEGWAKPTKIIWMATKLGHIPDATAWIGSKGYVFEVETADSISLEHTRQQCRLFSAYAYPRGGEFVLVAPTAERRRAQAQLAAWGIRGQVW